MRSKCAVDGELSSRRKGVRPLAVCPPHPTVDERCIYALFSGGAPLPSYYGWESVLRGCFL